MKLLPKATGALYSRSKYTGLQHTSPCPAPAPFRHSAIEEEVGEELQKEVREIGRKR